MVPGEIFHGALSRGRAHAFDNLRVSIQMLNRGRDCIDISWLNDDAFHAVADYIAGFARCDYRQTASGRFVNCFGASFQARRKNVNRSLIQIIIEVELESKDANIVASELL